MSQMGDCNEYGSRQVRSKEHRWQPRKFWWDVRNFVFIFFFILRIVSISFCNESLSAHPQRSTEHKGAQEQVRSTNNTLLGYSQAYHRGHQPMKDSSAQAQRSTGARGNPKQGLCEEQIPCPGPSQGCSSRLISPSVQVWHPLRRVIRTCSPDHLSD